jgi:hypothetical protein
MKKTLVDLAGSIKLQLTEGFEGGKHIMARGEFGRADVPTQNRRVYPRKVWDREIKKIQEAIAAGKVMGHISHPADGKTDLHKVSHIITGLHMDDEGRIIGEAKILDNEYGRQLRSILEAGGAVGISSRGMGSTAMGEDGSEVVQEDYQYMTHDFVADPAVLTSYPTFQTEVKWMDAPVMTETSDKEKEMKIKKSKVQLEAKAAGEAQDLNQAPEVQKPEEVKQAEAKLEEAPKEEVSPVSESPALEQHAEANVKAEAKDPWADETLEPSEHDEKSDMKYKELKKKRSAGDLSLKDKTDLELAVIAGLKPKEEAKDVEDKVLKVLNLLHDDQQDPEYVSPEFVHGYAQKRKIKLASDEVVLVSDLYGTDQDPTGRTIDWNEDSMNEAKTDVLKDLDPSHKKAVMMALDQLKQDGQEAVVKKVLSGKMSLDALGDWAEDKNYHGLASIFWNKPGVDHAVVMTGELAHRRADIGGGEEYPGERSDALDAKYDAAYGSNSDADRKYDEKFFNKDSSIKLRKLRTLKFLDHHQLTDTPTFKEIIKHIKNHEGDYKKYYQDYLADLEKIANEPMTGDFDEKDEEIKQYYLGQIAKLKALGKKYGLEEEVHEKSKTMSQHPYEALESIKALIKPLLLPEDVAVAVSKKDDEIATLKAENTELKSKIEQLGEVANRIGAQLHLERKVGELKEGRHEILKMARKQKLESVKAVDAFLIEAKQEIETRKQAERSQQLAQKRLEAQYESRMKAAEERSKKLEEALQSTVQYSKELGMKLYVSEKTRGNPNAIKIRELCEGKTDRKEVDSILERFSVATNKNEDYNAIKRRFERFKNTSLVEEQLENSSNRSSSRRSMDEGVLDEMKDLFPGATLDQVESLM